MEAFGRLAKEGTAVVVPGNVGDMGGMIASAMAVYGKVNEGQRKAMNAGRILEANPNNGANSSQSTEPTKTDDVAKTMLEDFERSRQANRRTSL